MIPKLNQVFKKLSTIPPLSLQIHLLNDMKYALNAAGWWLPIRFERIFAARGRRYGNICICIADSLCYKAEANTPL